jgi:hypothetical protein
MTRRLVMAALVLTMAVAGFYAAQALYVWEWTRALWMTMAFVAGEVALVGALVLGRLRRLEERLDDLDPASRHAERVRARLAGARPPEPDRFRWLQESVTRTNVFVTVLVGGGAVLSAVLWAVDKVAGHTVSPNRERQLAQRLGSIALPPEGLVPPDDIVLAADPARPDRADVALLLEGHRPAVGS